MSQETNEWLNTMTLIGFTDKRGTAWHYREALQGVEPNHYPGAIPVPDVIRRLFNFKVVERPLFVYRPADLQQEGEFVEVPDRKAMVTNDTGDVLGIFKSGYQGHQYEEWLLNNVAHVLDDDLSIGSAGLLKGRAQAWVSVEVPENITTPEGVVFRPHLIACTSFDGSLATTYKRAIQFVVCDNTLACGLGEQGQVYKVRHSKYSNLRLKDAREALAVVHTMADDFAAEVKRLTAWPVYEPDFQRHMDLMIPVPEEEGRSKTIALNKRDEIVRLYRSDERVAPWRDTAFGVVQAYNTWNHHYQTIRGAGRAQRNMENAITGKFAQADSDVLSKLALVSAA